MFKMLHSLSFYQSRSFLCKQQQEKTSAEITFKANIEWHFGDDGSVGVWLSYSGEQRARACKKASSKLETAHTGGRNEKTLDCWTGSEVFTFNSTVTYTSSSNRKRRWAKKNGASNISVLCHRRGATILQNAINGIESRSLDTHTYTYTLCGICIVELEI